MNAVDLIPPPQTPAPQSVNFDSLPPPVQTPDDARVRRFLGAFSGAVVGLGATLSLMPLGDASCFSGFGGGCVSALHVLSGTLAPLMALGGAWLGFEIMGGDAGLVTPVIALAPAILVALALLSVAREVDATSIISLMPYVIASGAFLAGGAALALDLRARQIGNLGGAASWGKASAGRVAVTGLVTALSSTGAALLTALLFVAANYTALGPVLAVLGAATGSIGVAGAAWGVHRAMNGRGTFLAALTGLGLGWLVTLGGGALFALSQGGFTSFSAARNTGGTLLLAELGLAAAIFSPLLALEWSHTNAVEESLPKFSFSAAPIPQGGMLAAAVRF